MRFSVGYIEVAVAGRPLAVLPIDGTSGWKSLPRMSEVSHKADSSGDVRCAEAAPVGTRRWTAPGEPSEATSSPAAGLVHPGDPRDRYFRTDHLVADLKGRSVRGAVVTIGAQGVKFSLQMASTMILARLLTPADFGLVAMVTGVAGFVVQFKDAGFSMATVQRQHITHDQFSTLFWINVALSVAVMAVVAALAPAIAWFYSEPRLLSITLALAATFIFSGLTVQHQALLRRQMKFTALAAIETGAIAIGIAIAVLMAWQGFGYWALVGMTAGSTIANFVLVWIFSGWRPGRPRRRTGVRPMLTFGGTISLSTLLTYFAENIDYVLLGWMWGAGPLGLYRKSYEIMMLPVRQLNAPMASVMLPALSRLRVDPTAFQRAYLRTLQFLAMAGMPIAWLLVLDAPEVTLLLLGPGWEGTAGLIRLLAPAAFIATLYSAPGYIFLALGQGRRQLNASMVDAVVVAAVIPAGTFWGAPGIAIAISVATVISLTARTVYACKEAPIAFNQILSALQPVALASVISTSCVGLIKWTRSDTGVEWILIDFVLLLLITLASLSLSLSGRVLLTSAYYSLRPKNGRAGDTR